MEERLRAYMLGLTKKLSWRWRRHLIKPSELAFVIILESPGGVGNESTVAINHRVFIRLLTIPIYLSFLRTE
jgi:hypothetical protein